MYVCVLISVQSKNNTVFFLSAVDNYQPIGFVSTPSPVTTIQWSSEPAPLHLLVCCEDGSMLEVEAPQKHQYDTSKSYYLDPLKYTAKQFTSIKDKLRVSVYCMDSLYEYSVTYSLEIIMRIASQCSLHGNY